MAKDDRADRLAKALRDNLRRRKAQAREISDPVEAPATARPGDPETDG